MATVKEEMLEWVEALPDECTWEDLHYFLYVREKVSEGSQAENARMAEILWTEAALMHVREIVEYGCGFVHER